MERRRGIPDGGFCLIPASHLVAAWWAYKRGIIKLVDLRVWLATFEVLARRCAMGEGRKPRFTFAEFKPLVGGVGGEHTKRSIGRLTSAGLIRWSETSIEHTCTMEAVGEGRSLSETLDLVTNRRRRVPMPRRVVRLLAKSSQSSLIATTLGHALRCLYFRSRAVRSDGLCKASWIAELFEIDERSVKRARSELAASGLLLLGTARQFVLNRYGLPVSFALDWAGDQSGLSPREQFPTIKLPPPMKTGISLPRSENQKLRDPNRNGVRKRTSRGTSLGNVRTQDLTRLESLRVIAQSWARSRGRRLTEQDELLVFMAARHAIRVGRTNPCGLFAWTLRRSEWGYMSLADEDAGRQDLRRVRESSLGRGAGNRQAIEHLVRKAAGERSLTLLLTRDSASKSEQKTM